MVDISLSWAEGADTNLSLPQYETKGAAGADLRANFAPDNRATGVTLAAGSRTLVSTGLHIEIPLGYEVQIRPRSGLALKYGVATLNAPGTIDSDYRGIIGVILYNSSDQDFHIRHGDRVAQMVVAPVQQAVFALKATLGETDRGQGGFGSTGKS
jgi:dUTP pyrophosphatase